MPDTSKMSPEEYKAFTDKMSFPAGVLKDERKAMSVDTMIKLEKAWQAANANMENVPKDLMPASISQRADDSPGFKTGQTVWNRHTHEMFDVIAVDRSSLWCWSFSRSHYETISADDLVATDPRKTIAPPQHCPFCGHEAAVLERPTASRVQCNAMTCDFSGPGRQNRLKAIEAWNSIHVQSTAPGLKS